jgi:hypothetical protein
MPKAYSFSKKSTTQEMHIFEGDFTPTNCDAPNSSICNKTTTSQGVWIPNAGCLTDQKARVKASELGREVCGDCVSHLYKTY